MAIDDLDATLALNFMLLTLQIGFLLLRILLLVYLDPGVLITLMRMFDLWSVTRK